MKIKTKIILSFGFLFLMIILLGSVGSFYVRQLGNDAAEILKENNRSLIYMENIDNDLDVILKQVTVDDQLPSSEIIPNIEENLELQKANITELGEKGLTAELENSFGALLAAMENGNMDQIKRNVFQAKQLARKIYNLNQEKILVRNEKVTKTAKEVYIYITSVSFCAFVIAFFFSIGMPGYLIKPIQRFNEAIKKIAAGNYSTRIKINNNDEFGQLGNSFNFMSARLEEFESSSYSKILSEKKRLDSVINQMSEGILGLDDRKNIIFANKKMLSLLNVEESKVKGKYAPDIAVHNALLHNLLGPIMISNGKYSTESSPIKVTENNIEKLFSKQYFDITTTANGESNLLIGHVVMLHDITNFAEKDRAKTRFIATLSHELKTPVAAIEMGTDLLKNRQTGNLNDEQQNWLEVINNNNLRIKNIINEILELAQIESGSIEIRKEKIRLGKILELAVQAVQPFLRKKDIKIEVNNPTENVILEVDGQKLSWVLNNLLINAIRYAPKSSLISVNTLLSGKEVKISVRDEGKGITQEQKNNIFKPFFKGKNKNSSGTGLGLVISKEFVEAMGGKIGVTSQINEGAEFWIKFNIADNE
ncbi:hypothetical protein C7S20_07815 [Christiangramia fulva]|uniref:histidine kinase n=1 Tax=Christiangramia fulva TaxID=2126553 RepID=A0A2R3Z4J4_9FLAO|nr:ATP-binding protein [Christiangramia fulva]AVR45185.1 hypothetical protein C7S20_07815 [Christiangramia fulva]